ncbi:MAG: TonB-dependent receptor [Pseudomonas sp.]|uniref:TonB-dependent receptor n=1 Tax=Pseudomonas sp. TaxID=306 RepID=UPI0012280AB2|nr:TonB-dependent receptor [Pseudomonas sp.]RZI76929.1 MAG: TonB-dependent receptor [Pseudomonas sp.]
MNYKQALLLASVAMTSLSPQAQAQAQASSEGVSEPTSDIIVSARRRDESLQDVPQTVNAVSSDTIQKLRINNASDIAQIVPGLTIEGGSSGSGGFGASSGMRGVPTFLNSNASPVVQFYLNDAPTGRGPEVTQSLFDIGQIEVLKGPQGTLRGRSAPTGAITITSRRPDLDEVGGFVNLSGSTRGNINAQAAVNVPLIAGVLALRVAGAVDHNEGNGVTSANLRADPYVKSESLRATLRFEPSADFNATVMYQRLWRDTRSFLQVIGNGNGTNGPVITAKDRLGITDGPSESSSALDFVVGQAELRFGGQKLSYVGSYRNGRSTGRTPQDVANVLPGIEYYQFTSTPAEEVSQELRLSSEERIADIFDYTLGVFYDRETSHPTVNGVASFLTGAFGRPGAPIVGAPLDRYTLNTVIGIAPVVTEKSVFGSVTAHLGENTELSAGGRYIDFKRRDRYTLGLQGGFNALNNPTGGFVPCAGLGALSPQLAGAVASPVYTGVCDLPIPSQTLQNVDRSTKFTPFLYNVSLSHKFSPDFMVYGNVGSAFRSAGPQIGLTSLTTCCTQVGGPSLASIDDLIFHGQEDSTTYELGFKSTFFDRRVRLNVSVFKQTFDNFFFLTQATRYLSVTTNLAGANVSSSEFTADAKAKVKGIDVEAGFQITPRWNLDLGFSWSKAQLDDALIPCNDGNFDGVVDTIVPTTQAFVNAGVIVARCRSSESISRTPRWNLTAQSEYSAPISDAMDGFLRGNFVYYPDNPNSSQGVVIDKYSLLNLFAGVRSSDNAWEISLFANNVLNTQQVLSINPVAPVSSGNAAVAFARPASGYQQIAYTPRREFGLLVRYAFGAR